MGLYLGNSNKLKLNLSNIKYNAKVLVPKRLPIGYTRLDYIESTKTQYIDTGFNPNQDTRVVCKAQYTDIVETGLLFGYRYSNTSDRYEFFVTGGLLYSSYNTSSGQIGKATADPLMIDKNKNITSVNDVIVGTEDPATFQGQGTLFLFCTNRNGKPGLHSSAKLYSCKIYDNGILVRDFTPCINPNGEVGMYDKVNGQFYGNAGTGEFTYGLSFVEYIETTGTQYIDTGFIPNNNTRVVMDFSVPELDEHNRIFGCRTGSSTRMFMFVRHSGGAWRFGYGDNQTGDVTGDAKRHIVNFNKNTFSIDGSLLYTLDEAEFTSPCTLTLGGIASGSVVQCGHVRMYACRVYDNVTLVRDFVPCVTASGEVGMYDKVNGQFYSNSGDGSFTHA